MSYHVGLFKYLSSDGGGGGGGNIIYSFIKKKKIIHAEVAKSIHVGIYIIVITTCQNIYLATY